MMIWLAILTAYCLACALWSLSERRERDELRHIGRRLAAWWGRNTHGGN